jgi:hypothetical protein
MTHKLKPGDRVRVTTNIRRLGCQPGDKGIVLVGPISPPPFPRGGGKPYYLVAMDDAGEDSTCTIFSADDIELDV